MPLTRDQIITDLWRSSDLQSAIRKMKPVDLQEDLRQEIFVVLCLMDEERLIQLWTDKRLSFYIFGMMRNMIASNSSTFFNTHRKFGQLVTEEPTEALPDHGADHDLMASIEPAISQLDPYEAELIKLYAEMGRDCRPVANATGINIRSVRYAVTAAKTNMKKKLRQHAE